MNREKPGQGQWCPAQRVTTGLQGVRALSTGVPRGGMGACIEHSRSWPAGNQSLISQRKRNPLRVGLGLVLTPEREEAKQGSLHGWSIPIICSVLQLFVLKPCSPVTFGRWLSGVTRGAARLRPKVLPGAGGDGWDPTAGGLQLFCSSSARARARSGRCPSHRQLRRYRGGMHGAGGWSRPSSVPAHGIPTPAPCSFFTSSHPSKSPHAECRAACETRENGNKPGREETECLGRREP